MATFEEQLAELEGVVERLESGELTLEENVALFERGVKLSNACKTQLASAESRIQVLLDPQEDKPARSEEMALDVADEEDEEELDDDGRL